MPATLIFAFIVGEQLLEQTGAPTNRAMSDGPGTTWVDQFPIVVQFASAPCPVHVKGTVAFPSRWKKSSCATPLLESRVRNRIGKRVFSPKFFKAPQPRCFTGSQTTK